MLQDKHIKETYKSRIRPGSALAEGTTFLSNQDDVFWGFFPLITGMIMSVCGLHAFRDYPPYSTAHIFIFLFYNFFFFLQNRPDACDGFSFSNTNIARS